MVTKSDDQMTALAAAGYGVGSLADRQRAYLIGNRGYAGPVASIADMLQSLGLTNDFLPLLDLGAGSAWTPASLGSALRVWLDPSDSSTLTMAASKVSQINDKSGNNFHYSQATDARRPSLIAVNGKNALDFNTDHVLSTASNNTVPLGTTQTVLAVVTPSTAAAGSYLVTLTDGTGNTNHLALISNFGSVPFEVYAQTLTTTRFTVAGAAAGQNVVGFTRNGNNFAGRFNGAAAGSSISTGNNNNAFARSLGGQDEGASVLSSTVGKICEVIITNTVLSPADLTSAEAYLKAKWNTP